MQPHSIFSTIAAAAALLTAVLPPAPASAQAPSPGQAPPQEQAPAPAPPKPYKQVAITLPTAGKDATLDAFRKQLAEIAQRRDRAALASLVVSRGFFWERENGNGADAKKSGIDNFAAAIGLDAKDGSGWLILADYASDPTASPVGDRRDLLCAPGEPLFDDQALEAVAQATETDIGEWGYPLADGIEVRSSAMPEAKVEQKLGLYFVRVMPDDSPLTAAANFLRIVTPSGKLGFIPADSIAPLGVEQLCYLKEGPRWKIAGYVGEGPQH